MEQSYREAEGEFAVSAIETAAAKAEQEAMAAKCMNLVLSS